jgi:hypothetical protein
MSTASAAAGAAAAAAVARARREEEESMTTYSRADLAEDWEFKIVRSATGAFKNRHLLQQVVEEEARAGWVLVEKFDNQRLRFKRPASARAGDATRDFDPYRTTYGISEGKLAATIIVTMFSIIGLVILIIVLVT